MDHVIYGTLLECNHTEKSSTKKNNQTTQGLNKPQMCFEIRMCAESKFLLILKNKQTKPKIDHYTL